MIAGSGIGPAGQGIGAMFRVLASVGKETA
jgi:hypothetical protein